MFTRLAEISFGLIVLSLPFLRGNDDTSGAGITTGSGIIKKLISGERKKEKLNEQVAAEFRCEQEDAESETSSRHSGSRNPKRRNKRRRSTLQKLEQSENMMSSVSSMGSSIRNARLNDSGITVTSDFSNMTIKESLAERHFW